MPVIPLLWALSLALLAPGARDRPNVLLVIADDIGTGRIAAYDEHPSPARTPNLDALASQGVLFRNAWSHPVCSPTRVAMLTGRHGFRTGIGTSIPFDVSGPALGSGGPAGILASEYPLAHLMRRAGYRTAAIGKWHMANTDTGGFDHPILMGFELHKGAISVTGYKNWNKNVADANGSTQFTEPAYVTSVNVDDALATIESFGGDPWFVWTAFTSAHEPYHVPPLELLSPETQALVTADAPSDETLHKAMVEAMDTEFGRLLTGIRPSVLANTIVIFLADNGTPDDSIGDPELEPQAGSKGGLTEGGVNVPMIVAGKGVAVGRETAALACDVDLFATILAAAGAPLPPTTVDGRSLLPVLVDPDAPGERRVAFTERMVPNGFGPFNKLKRAVRDDRYKIIQTISPPVDAGMRFYDLLLDPKEQDNLNADDSPPLAPELQEAFDRLAAVLAGVG